MTGDKEPVYMGKVTQVDAGKYIFRRINL